MPDIAALSSALSSIKAATDIVKLVRESGTTLEKAEVKLKLAELMEKLADAKIELASVQDLIEGKERRIRELERSTAVHKQLTFDSPYYWMKKASGRDGPFCQQCYDSARKVIRLQGDGNGYWECKTCKNAYTDRSFRNAPIDYPDNGIV